MYLFLPFDALNSFSDMILLRDPRGRSIFRSLHQLPAVPGTHGKGAPRARGAGIGVTGPFLMHQLFVVRREHGVGFVTTTGDDNPIHREGDVVPGAMTVARASASLEALCPQLGIRRLGFKFRAIARYDRPIRQQLAISFPSGDRLEAKVRIDQEGQDVAEGFISARIHPTVQRPNVGKWRVNKEELRRVEEFFRSLAITPELFLRAGDELNYAYPRGFLASLPSGAMVRQLSGEGGLLSSLELGFPEGPPPGITGSGCPEVSLEKAKSRPSFWKVLTWVRHGVDEHCRGFALVFSPKATAEAAIV